MKDNYPRTNREGFGKYLKIKRKRTRRNGKRLRQLDVGREFNYETGNQISLWELGKKLPENREMVGRLATLYHCSPDETKEMIYLYKKAVDEKHGF